MSSILIYPAGNTQACHCASTVLQKHGIPLVDHPTPEVTHLLLDIPSFREKNILKDGTPLPEILERLPENTTVIGGNLSADTASGHSTIDLLQDPYYLAQNAWITAECAIGLVRSKLPVVLRNCPVVVVGWGRIGKALAELLSRTGAQVTVAARNGSDLAMAQALGLRTVTTDQLSTGIPPCRVILNTVPCPVIPAATADALKLCLKIDLASMPGIGGEDVLHARGLPGIHAPESSGQLIAETIIRLVGGAL